MSAPNAPYRIIAMGKTGSGKSAVLNSLSKSKHFEEGAGIHSQTREVASFRSKFRGRTDAPEIVFVDTPGFFDSSATDSGVIASIAHSLSLIEDGINLVLFCFPAYEIRIDSSLQSSLRFLRLVMGKAVYEHVVIVITHGNRLFENELETAVGRMTREFFPYIRAQLGLAVRDEVFVFRKGEDSDGLEDIFKLIVSNKKYKPKVMGELEQFWNAEDPAGSISRLLENSSTFRRIQDMLLAAQNKTQAVQTQVETIRTQVDVLARKQPRLLSVELGDVESGLGRKLSAHCKAIDDVKREVTGKLLRIQKELDDKNWQIALLHRGIEEAKRGQSQKRQPRAAPKPAPERAGKERSGRHIALADVRPATTRNEEAPLRADRLLHKGLASTLRHVTPKRTQASCHHIKTPSTLRTTKRGNKAVNQSVLSRRDPSDSSKSHTQPLNRSSHKCIMYSSNKKL